jgi:hypothetical protein
VGGEIHSPLALVILLLGTNDFQSMHPHDAWHAAQGIATLVTAIRQASIEPGMAIPPVLVVAPPPVQEPRGPIAPKFRGAAAKGSAWRGRTGRSRRRSAARSSTRRRSLCLRLQRGGGVRGWGVMAWGRGRRCGGAGARGC